MWGKCRDSESFSGEQKICFHKACNILGRAMVSTKGSTGQTQDSSNLINYSAVALWPPFRRSAMISKLTRQMLMSM